MIFQIELIHDEDNHDVQNNYVLIRNIEKLAIFDVQCLIILLG